MGRKYQFLSTENPHFVTFTVIFWIDIFTRQAYRDIFLDSLRFCQKHKGLIVHGWVIMSNHVHMIINCNGEQPLSHVVRDLKKYTSCKIVEEIENSEEESRKKWLLWMMAAAGKNNSSNKNYQFWQQHSKPVELYTNTVMDQKLNYIHENPVKAGIVNTPEAYLYSSAGSYAGLPDQALVEVEFLD